MKLVLPLIVVATASLAQLAHATSITFGGTGANRSIFDSTNTQVASGSLVWIGNFATPPPGSFTLDAGLTFTQNVNSIISQGGWEQFGVDTSTSVANAGVTSTIQISGTGKAAGIVTDNNFGATKATYFDSKDLYLWVFNAPTVGAATEMGIFRAPSSGQLGGFVPWTFPVNDGAGGSVTLSTNPATSQIINAIGGVGVGSNGSSSLGLTGIVAVPEPSTMILGAFTFLAAVSSRRRVR